MKERCRDGCRTSLLIAGVVLVPTIFHTLLPPCHPYITIHFMEMIFSTCMIYVSKQLECFIFSDKNKNLRKRTTSLERTNGSSPCCTLLGGSTVIRVSIMPTHTHTHTLSLCLSGGTLHRRKTARSSQSTSLHRY